MWMQLELAYLSSSLFLISFVGVILAAYRKHLLKRIRVRVNCWFCNEFTRVPFDERNCFYCPSCKQYNGFRSDGGYNRSIPEQYDELLNPQLLHSNGKRTTVANGLCRLCNNNQQLKIYQLAHFVPMREENYDIEIEHFQKQLEKAYKLCSKCDKVVKKTILKQNKWMLGLRILSARGKYPATSKTSKLSPWRGVIYTSAVFLSSFAAYLIVYKYERSKSIIKSFYEKLLEHSGPLQQGLRKTAFFKENYTLVISTGIVGLVVSTILAFYFTRSRQKSHCHNTAVVTEHRTNPKPSSTPTNFNTSGALDSDYESFHEALTKKRRPKKARTTPVFGQGPVFENSLSKSPSPVSFKDLNVSFSSARNVRSFSPRQNNSFNSVHNETFSSFGNNTFNSAQSNTLSFGRNDTFNSLRNDTLNSARNDTFSSSRNETKPQVFNDLDVCLSNLKLNSNYVRPQPLFARPPSLRNPWTGQSWHDEPLSRSSSQSSGVYSSVEFPTSICGDECRSIVSEPLFKCTYVYKSQGGSAFSKYSNGRWDDEPRSLFEAKSPRTSLFM